MKIVKNMMDLFIIMRCIADIVIQSERVCFTAHQMQYS